MWNNSNDTRAWRLHRRIEHDIKLAQEHPQRYTTDYLEDVRRDYGTLLFDINLGHTDIWSLKAAKRYAQQGILPVYEHGFGRNACGAYLWHYIQDNPNTTHEEFKRLIEPMCVTNRTTQVENQKLREVQITQPFGALWTQEYIYELAGVPTLKLTLPTGRKSWSQSLMKQMLKQMNVDI